MVRQKGRQLVRDIDPLSLTRFIDRRALFMQHWRFRSGGDPVAFERRVVAALEPMLAARMEKFAAAGAWTPQAVFEVFPSWSDGDSVVLARVDGPAGDLLPVFSVPFVRDARGQCIADSVRPCGPDGVARDATGWFAATLGPGPAVFEAGLRDAGDFEEYHLFHGLSAALAEALAEEIHRRVRIDLGVPDPPSLGPADIVAGRYPGRRFSFGYSCCPDLSRQAQLLDLLGAGEIGITLNETMQMEPELSVTAGIISR